MIRPASIAPPVGVVEGYRYMAPVVERDGEAVRIDALGVYFQQLNDAVRSEIAAGAKLIRIANVNGQRYIGTGLGVSGVKIEIEGTAGNDLAMLTDGIEVEVFGNAQDGAGNTMSNGRIVVHGDAGDVLGYGMRGGRVYVKGDVGYRVGIHMKAFEKSVPVLVCGGKARDFFGEYMAGGILVLLGMFSDDPEKPVHGYCFGTGMHGGTIFVRGGVDESKLSREVGVFELTGEDRKELEGYLKEYCRDLKLDPKEVLAEKFVKVLPKSKRPYGDLYCPMPR